MNESSNANDKGAHEGTPPGNGKPLPTTQPPSSGASSDDFGFVEPQLEAAEISEDVAESVDLKAAEREAARVEHEAHLAAQSVSPGRSETPPILSDADASDETAPEIPSTETAPEIPQTLDAPAAPPATAAPHVGPGIDDGHGWRRSETPWQPKAGSWQSPAQIARSEADSAAAVAAAGQISAPGVPPIPEQNVDPQALGGSGEPPKPSVPQAPGTIDGPPEPGGFPPAPGETNGSDGGMKKLLIILAIALVGVGLLGLLIWLLINVISNGSASEANNTTTVQARESVLTVSTAPEATSADGDDVIMAQASPLDWLDGDCFRDFKNATTPADVVRCSSPHTAQLVGTFYYAVDDTFPGQAAIKAKAVEVCENVQLTTEAASIETLKQMTAYPTENTWTEANDRRVDCIVYDTRGGNLLESSLTQ